VRIVRGQTDSTGASPPTDPYVIALLSGGRALAVGAAVAELHRRKLIDVATAKQWTLLPEGDRHNLHPFEARVLQAAATTTTIPTLVKELNLDLAALEAKLESQHFLNPKEKTTHTRWIVFLVTLIPVALGLAKILIGIDRHRPVEILMMLEMACVFISLILTTTVQRRTSEGKATLKALRKDMIHLKSKTALTLEAGDTAQELPLAMAVFGASVLSLTPLAPLQQRLGLVTDSSSGGDGGSSGCGGGGSGCGGCGGGH